MSVSAPAAITAACAAMSQRVVEPVRFASLEIIRRWRDAESALDPGHRIAERGPHRLLDHAFKNAVALLL
jgi:hypothetical protein